MSGLLATLAAEREVARAPAPAPKPAAQRESKPKRRTPWQQKELDGLPDRITLAEAEVAALDARLADPALYAGPKEEIQRVRAKRAELAASVEKIYARWEELEAL
jgi:ATP-binding cassette subfamily F protein uup